MNRYIRALLVGGCGALLASYAMAYTGTYTPDTGINGTVHDLSKPVNGMGAYNANPPDSGLADNLGGATANPRICIFCHAPHNTYKLSQANGGPPSATGAGPTAPDAYDYLPLWNHTVTTYAAYDMYQNGPGAPQSGSHSSYAALNPPTNPGGTSMLCLSCHDGSIAVNSYGNSAQLSKSVSGGGAKMADTYTIGKDAYLGNHHPIGFSYTSAQLSDTELRLPTYTMGGAGTIADHLYGADGTMECGSCHSVHNTGNTGETLLWRSDQSSRLCLTCHAKGTPPGATTP